MSIISALNALKLELRQPEVAKWPTYGRPRKQSRSRAWERVAVLSGIGLVQGLWRSFDV
jgi:hypothetical protein